MPPLFSLNFERGADLDPDMRKEVVRRGWEVAASNAYPWLLVTDGDLVSQPIAMKDVVKAEALALAFTRLMDEKKTMRAAWASGENAIFTIPVETSGGAFEVRVGTPL